MSAIASLCVNTVRFVREADCPPGSGFKAAAEFTPEINELSQRHYVNQSRVWALGLDEYVFSFAREVEGDCHSDCLE